MYTSNTPQDIIFEIAKTDKHFEQMLALQKENLFTSISEDIQSQQGFVYAQHTISLLKNMSAQLPQVIALHDNLVVGYNLAMTASMGKAIPRLTPMFNEFEKCIYHNKPLTNYKFMVGGQVCVDKNFRGLGLMSRLYNETVKRLPPGYELCTTEISKRNTISLNAHLKTGFEIIATYPDGNEIWDIVVWDIRKL